MKQSFRSSLFQPLVSVSSHWQEAPKRLPLYQLFPLCCEGVEGFLNGPMGSKTSKESEASEPFLFLKPGVGVAAEAWVQVHFAVM